MVVDGAYAKRPFLERVLATGAIVVSRLRKDAALYDVPSPPKHRGRGRPRKYGPNRLSLAGKAAHRHGWQTDTFELYGRRVDKVYKTFLATYAPVGGVIRVVLMREQDSLVAFFATDPSLSGRDILQAVADRGTIERNFRDLKAVHGAGEQQVHNLWVNLAARHMTAWLYTLIELWSWRTSASRLVDRRFASLGRRRSVSKPLGPP